MTNNERDIFQSLKELRMSGASRAHMRSELSSYADLHSMPATEQAPFNTISFIVNVFSHSRPAFAGALALVVVISTGGVTVMASEKALPGDALYPVKLHVAEPVASVFAGGGAAGARFHAKLAVRRVAEAEALQEKGALTKEQEQELAERFSRESDRAEAEADRLALSGDYSASLLIRTELSSDLKAHVREDAPSPEVAATAMMASAPTRMAAKMKEPENDVAPENESSLMQLVAQKVARLEAFQIVPEAKAERPHVGAAESKDTSPRAAVRTLLSGSSVVEHHTEEPSATTTEASSEAPKEPVIRAKGGSTHESTHREDRSLDAESILQNTVSNPARLIPDNVLEGL